MERTNRRLAGAAVALLLCAATAAQRRDTLRVFDEVTFYDGYQETVVDADVDDGVLRHSNSLYAVKLPAEMPVAEDDSLVMTVRVRACCDNYDRIGDVSLAFVPRGAAGYRPEEVRRIELGRFITPFMDRNRQPDEVVYRYDAGFLGCILRDRALRRRYDLWMELGLFGVPYAAQKQVAGCEGRTDTFEGTLELSGLRTGHRVRPQRGHVLVPVVCKKPGAYGGNLNNYDPAATDTVGRTVKTWTFEVPRAVEDGQIVLITSNHGANEGGEEYIRRWHYVYVDGELVTTYMPGRPTCEPFRRVNTQGNGIYGRSPKPDYVWQSFSNWCPGDRIDNRILALGRVEAGTHRLTVAVPEARFAGGQGDIPVSAFFQGVERGRLPAAEMNIGRETERLARVWMEEPVLRMEATEASGPVEAVELCAADGQRVLWSERMTPVDLTAFPSGVYLLNLYCVDGRVETYRVEWSPR